MSGPPVGKGGREEGAHVDTLSDRCRRRREGSPQTVRPRSVLHVRPVDESSVQWYLLQKDSKRTGHGDQVSLLVALVRLVHPRSSTSDGGRDGGRAERRVRGRDGGRVEKRAGGRDGGGSLGQDDIIPVWSRSNRVHTYRKGPKGPACLRRELDRSSRVPTGGLTSRASSHPG